MTFSSHSFFHFTSSLKAPYLLNTLCIEIAYTLVTSLYVMYISSFIDRRGLRRKMYTDTGMNF